MIPTSQIRDLRDAASACADKPRPLHIPCEAFTVGEYIEDELIERNWTTLDCARRMGGDVYVDALTLDLHIAAAHAPPGHAICNGFMGKQTADGLGLAFGVDGQTFLNLDAAYHWQRYIAKADPTTVKTMCDELLQLKGYFDVFQERLNKGCSHCPRDKETGFILNHCDSCCRKLTAGVCDVLDKLQADSLTGDEG